MDIVIYVEKNLESKEVKFGLTEEFLIELKKKFKGEDKELVKMAKLRRIKQRRRTIEELVQEFQKAMRNSKYKERVLIEEFKGRINKVIKKKLMKIERPPTSIEQEYECAIDLDKY